VTEPSLNTGYRFGIESAFLKPAKESEVSAFNVILHSEYCRWPLIELIIQTLLFLILNLVSLLV